MVDNVMLDTTTAAGGRNNNNNNKTKGGNNNNNNNNNNNSNNNGNNNTNKNNNANLVRPPLCFPDPADPIDYQCLTDEGSPSISKTCLQLCQRCRCHATAPIHPTTLASFWKKAWNDGIQCLKYHKDRRCRILAGQMLATTAKAMYGIIRPNVLLMGCRDPLTGSIEDDVLDVTAALISAALDDPDDGVAGMVLTQLGHLVLSNTTTFGGIFDDSDEFIQIGSLSVDGTTIPSPYAPTLRSVSVEDIAIPIQELQHRVLEQLVSRILPLVHRQLRLSTTWPIITQVILYMTRQNQVQRPSLDRETYSKRWTQLDGIGLASMFHETMLLPAMASCANAAAAYTAAVCATRLGMARSSKDNNSSGNHNNIVIIAQVLREAASDDAATALPALLIALRDVELSQRIRTLLWIATTSSFGSSSIVQSHPTKTTAVWTEMALQLVWYGPATTTTTTTTTTNGPTTTTTSSSSCRPDCIRIFNTNEMPMEFRYALLEVTFQIGKRLYDGAIEHADRNNGDEWIDVAETVLETTETDPTNESTLNLATATATAYLQLRLLYLHATGNLNPATSIALRCSGDSPPHLLYDTLTNTASFLGRHDPPLVVAERESSVKITMLWKQQPEKNFFGWFLWALSVDQWIIAQQRELEKASNNTGANNATVTLDVTTGKDLIRPPHVDFARMGIAGLESIALIATEFRRRAGSTAETKMLVGAAIGQLKTIDEKAVARVQKCYEQGRPQMGHSELVMGNVKIKIKPLTSKVHRTLTVEEFQMAECRQRVAARLAVADGRRWGYRCSALGSRSVAVCSAPSDPCQLVVAYSPVRVCRHDGGVAFQIRATLCLYNTTQFEINDGLRLEISLTSEDGDDGSDWNLADFDPETPLFSRSTICNETFKPGEYILWDVDLTDIDSSNSYQLVPSIVYMNVPSEKDKIKWAATTKNGGEGSTVGEAQSKSGEDDFRVAATSGKLNDKVENVRLVGIPMTLPPLIFLQPDPLVFVDRNGDVDTFRLLWFRSVYILPPIHLTPSNSENIPTDPVTSKIAKMACLAWEGEAVPEGVATALWAFASLSEHRVFVMQTATTNDAAANGSSTLHIRGDDSQTLYSVCGSSKSRNSFVRSLLPGMKCQ